MAPKAEPAEEQHESDSGTALAEPENEPAPPAEKPSDPVIRLRRSTLIFAIIMAVVLMFITYALGRRARAEAAPPAQNSIERQDVNQAATPSLPARLVGKSAIFLKEFDSTQRASQANALAYRNHIAESADAAFIRQAGKSPFVLMVGRDRKLAVCIGPFDSIAGPEIDAMLAKARALTFNGVKPFHAAYTAKLPSAAKICE